MTTISHKVADSLYLVHQSLVSQASTPAKPVEVSTNHIFACDCSGSMSFDLPKMREQLKKKLRLLLKEGDTFSLIWFSGKGQCGLLCEGEPVATLGDLSTVYTMVDRWLKPVGMTGFKEPLELIPSLVERLKKVHPKNVNAFLFLSDGYENQWPRQEVLQVTERIANLFASATVMEYGYYADRVLLTAMAEKLGGSLLFAQNFDSYEPSFEAVLKKRAVGGSEKRMDIGLQGEPMEGFAFVVSRGTQCSDIDGSGRSPGGEGELIAHVAETRVASRGSVKPRHYVSGVSPSAAMLHYLSPVAVGDEGIQLKDLPQGAHGVGIDALYAAISLFAVRMKPEIVYPLLKVSGDIRLIDLFAGCFGKQKYSDFMEAAKACALNPALRLTQGYDPKRVPRDDAFTVLDMLKLLASDEDNKILLEHEAFKHSPISRGRIDANTMLTPDEQAQVDKLMEEWTKAGKTTKKALKLSQQIAALLDAKPKPLKFVADHAPVGYSVLNLTYNEEHPNVSVLVKKTGYVDLIGHIPPELCFESAHRFETFIYRNYPIVKDGLVNIDVLPVQLSPATLTKLFAAHKDGQLGDDVVTSNGGVTFLNLKPLPILNRKSVKAVSAKALFELEWELLKVQGAQKVYKDALKTQFGNKKSPSFEETYGKPAAEWLKQQGFTDYSGFSPKSVQAESTDVYFAKEMEVSIKGHSTLPSVNEYKKQLAKGKLSLAAELMRSAMEIVEEGEGPSETWLKTQERALDKKRRALLVEKAQIIFSVIVGQVWFTEFASLDENSMTLVKDGKTLECKVELREREIKI